MFGMVIALLASSLTPRPAGALNWLEGQWSESKADNSWTCEQWRFLPQDNKLIGISWSGKDKALRSRETMRIIEGEDGIPIFIASSDGAPDVMFTLVENGENSATFENLTHDFPKRIRYSREGDLLRAEISGLNGEKALGWTYRRRVWTEIHGSNGEVTLGWADPC